MQIEKVKAALLAALQSPDHEPDRDLAKHLRALIKGTTFPKFKFTAKERTDFRKAVQAKAMPELVTNLALELCDLAAGRVQRHADGRRTKVGFQDKPPVTTRAEKIQPWQAQGKKDVAQARRLHGAALTLARKTAESARLFVDVAGTPAPLRSADIQKLERLMQRVTDWVEYEAHIDSGFQAGKKKAHGRPQDTRRNLLERELMTLLMKAGLRQRSAAKLTDKLLQAYRFTTRSRWESIEYRHIQRRKSAAN